MKKQTKKSNEPTYEEIKSLLKDCRDLLVMCTLIDKSGHCLKQVEVVDEKMRWK